MATEMIILGAALVLAGVLAGVLLSIWLIHETVTAIIRTLLDIGGEDQ